MDTSDVPKLVDLRARLLQRGDPAELDEVTSQLRDLLASSPPRTRRVRWDEPGDLIERLAVAEPVHPVRGQDDLADRFDEDRRCYVLEHPLLPGRPLNVVWVALWRGIAADISKVLDPTAPTTDPGAADTAVFYSIWSAEPGLAGLPSGRALLEGAIPLLRAELPGLETFVTLSPVPGFRAWLEDRHDAGDAPDGRLLEHAARYLTSLDEHGRPLDPVARFHLRNGARLLRLNRHGDTSERGLARSFGIMANYRYEPEDRAANRRALEQGAVARSPEVDELLHPQP